MDSLSKLENESIYIIRESFSLHSNLAVLWSMGKDSTVLLWLCRKAFFGHIPFPVIHIDTSYKFDEIYRFRDHLTKEWKLNLIIQRNEKALAENMGPARFDTLACCHALKTAALKEAIKNLKLDALLLGIRRDEHSIRSKERYFSPRDLDSHWNYRDQPPELWDLYESSATDDTHVRVHPLLHMNEVDIWRYIQRENIPTNPLYFAQGGQRFRSIGCKTCCKAVPSEVASVEEIVNELETSRVAERTGRAQDKEDEYTMQRLRSLGYM